MDDEAIRPAVDKDFPAVAALRWQWLVEGKGSARSDSKETFVGLFASWLRGHADTHRCLVVEQDGVLVGFAIVAYFDRVPTAQALERTSAELQSLYVVPFARNTGVGARLIDAALNAARDSGAERITVHSSERAVTAYVRAGFSSSAQFMEQGLHS
ncbi:GNAT family N-acetyltransferase [Arthrobacter sp. ISL-5]|uniref:GNAT family N-acetyltransferase n=1 Tax=Arthrobacter sp. ISL-5 TaxID=2819111 RepID=UPI001BEBF9A6|nr:GNAT family N-acetyltransferase [Arthrobacter sp. ISL-5]MBT2555543.1 GNAT family N-acetyltransferase [Arthrobacter sp. ISL-5]